MTEETQELQEEQPQEEPKQEEPKQEETKPKGGSSGLAPNVAGTLCYVLGLVTGIIFLLIERENKFVRFHAMQSILFSIAVWLINFIVTSLLVATFFTGGFAAFGLLTTGLAVLYIVLWVMLMVKAYNNQEWELPLLGKIAKNFANK